MWRSSSEEKSSFYCNFWFGVERAFCREHVLSSWQKLCDKYICNSESVPAKTIQNRKGWRWRDELQIPTSPSELFVWNRQFLQLLLSRSGESTASTISTVEAEKLISFHGMFQLVKKLSRSNQLWKLCPFLPIGVGCCNARTRKGLYDRRAGLLWVLQQKVL